MKKALLLVSVLVASVLTSPGAQPPAASEVMRAAQAEAAAGNKTILLIFGAEWCSQCKILHRFLEQPEIKAIVTKHAVIADIQTGADRTSNPGAEVYEKKYGSLDQGYPFLLFLKADGSVIINSRINNTGDNIGRPELPPEIKWFMTMLEKGAPTMSPADRRTIESGLQRAR